MKSQNNYSLFILIPFFASISLGANIYVDNQLPDDCIGTYSVANRDSSGADGDAYNMIQEAANVAVAGDVVLIRGGIYYSTSMISMDGKNGLSGEEITISAFGEEEVIIDGSSITPTGYTPHNSIFYLQDSSFLIIEKISFRNSSNEGSGIYVFRSNDISISNNVFDNLNGHGIRLTGSSNCNVEFNELSGSMMGIHIIGYLSGNPPYANSEFNVIRNNLVYNNIVEPEHSDGIALSGGSFNNTIEDNVAYNNADDGIDSDGHSPGSNYTIIEGNIVFNNGYGGGGDGNGIKVSTNAGGGHLVANNVSFNNGRIGFDQDKEVGYPQNFFYNNIAYNNAAGGFGMDAPSLPQDEDAVLYNNVAVNNSVQDLRRSNELAVNDSDYNFWGDGGFVAGMDEHSLSGDPMLSNPGFVIDTNFDPAWGIEVKLNYIRSQVKAAFSPLQESPLIDAGTIIDGYHNPTAGSDSGDGKVWYGNAPDIGAYEYVPTDPDLQHTLLVESTIGGSVTNPGEGDFQRDDGTVLSLQAEPEEGYHFVSWTGTAVVAGRVLNPASASTTVTVDSDYTLQANFAVGQPRNLTISSTSGGTVTTPGTGTHVYEHGTPASVVATPNANYHFVNWTGTAVSAGRVANANSASTTVTMDADYTLQANFSIDQHNLTTSSSSGGTVTTPGVGTYPYNHGASASVVAAASSNYHFVNWTGTAVSSGRVANANAASTTVTMDAAYAIRANFALDQYALTVSSSTGGSVTSPGEGSFQYDGGTDVSIQASAANNYYFVNWTGTAVSAGRVANPNSASTTVTVDAGYTVRANFGQQDGVAPTVSSLSPASGSIQAPLTSLIVLHVTDAGIGVDADTVEITLDGAVIYTGDTSDYNSATGNCRRTGTPNDYTYAYQSDSIFDYDQLKTVTVNAADIGGIVMNQQSYSFRTEMRSFGQNKQVSSGLDSLSNGRASTVCDSSGNIWAVWHAGPAGSRDIYLGKLTAGADSFGASVRLTSNGSDQLNPAIALGTDDRLYVVWQDNRRGNWDIYGSTSANGTTWSAEQQIADSDDNQNYNQVNPALAVDGQSPNHAHVVWQDDRAGNYDIHIAESSDGFTTNAVTQVTSDTSSQTDPAVAVDSPNNRVYVLWTDARNTINGTDIYGASGSAWTNVPVVTKAANQSNPVVAVESVDNASILHVLWADQASGNGDIYYASSSGLPGSPLPGRNLVDDTLNTAQVWPTIAFSGTGGGLGVFACWQDSRNVSGGTGDVDLYMVQTNDSGSGTNVFVGDGGTNSDQTEPAMGIDQSGYPYVVWTDNRGTNPGIYYAGSTCMQSTVLVSGLVDVSSGGTIGTADVQNITDVDDVCISVPGGACSYDATISIIRVDNPQEFSLPILNGYEFSPSGMEFNYPVTITIPFAVSNTAGTPTAYWYNSVTGALSQQGMDNIEIIEVSPSLRALRFTTTHLTPYYALLGATSTSDSSVISSSSGGGGCSLSNSHQGNILEYFLPYVVLALAMFFIQWKDRRCKE